MRTIASRTALASLLMLAACGGDSGSSGGGTIVVPTPVPTVSPSPSPTPTATPPASGTLSLTGATAPVHDPAILRKDGTWYLFATGNVGDREGLLAMRTSTNLTDWQLRGPTFRQLPAWAATAVPGSSGLWAPDIIEHNGEFRLYYSVSTFGRNQSAIGLAVSTSLNPDSPDSGWTDRGIVMQSATTDDFNAIDPAVFNDQQGRQWMAFGSFWTGIKLIELDPATGLRRSGDTVRAIASRPFPGAIEAPYVIYRDGYYYLFASFDSCCQGSASTYNTVVGRSRQPDGPYLDRDGRAMLQGGGTAVLASGQGTGSRFVGRGHVAVVNDGGQSYIVYHAYDTQRNGFPTLQIQRLSWTDGWPTAE